MENAKAAPTVCYKCGHPGHQLRDYPSFASTSTPIPNSESTKPFSSFKATSTGIAKSSVIYIYITLDNSQSILIKDFKKFSITISKTYFINFNTSLYNTPNIKDFIFFTTSLKYYFLFSCCNINGCLFFKIFPIIPCGSACSFTILGCLCPRLCNTFSYL